MKKPEISPKNVDSIIDNLERYGKWIDTKMHDQEKYLEYLKTVPNVSEEESSPEQMILTSLRKTRDHINCTLADLDFLSYMVHLSYKT